MLQGAGGHAAQGRRKQTPGGTTRGVGMPAEQRESRAGSLGGGTDEKQAGGRWMSQACFVPVSTADEVTKTISSSPRVLTASSDHCYCPRQSNTTVWICRRGGKKKNDKKRIQRRFTLQRLGPGRHRDTRDSRMSGRGPGPGVQVGTAVAGFDYII